MTITDRGRKLPNITPAWTIKAEDIKPTYTVTADQLVSPITVEPCPECKIMLGHTSTCSRLGVVRRNQT